MPGKISRSPMSLAIHAALFSAAGTLVAPAGLAQSADGEERIEEVVVTGSRIVRRDFNANSPLVTVSEENLNAQAGTTFGVKLQQLPQVTPSANELTGSGQPTGRATLDLRGLGANRTLVLADGRRLPPSTAEMVVDLNNIPPGLVEDIEVITGGASAVYGSDAVAGVVNLRLKQDFEGLEASAQYNITELSDGEELAVDLLMGTNFGQDRGNIVIGLGYMDRQEAYFRDRDFYTRAFDVAAPPYASDILPQGNFVPDAANLPSQEAIDSIFANYGVAPGTVGPGNLLSVNPDETLFAQAGAVNYRGPQNDAYVVSPTTSSVAYNLGTLQLLTAPTERYSAYLKGDYDLSDSVNVYTQGIFTQYNSITNFGAGMQTQDTIAVVPPDNAFIPEDLRTLLNARPDPAAPFNMRKLWTATGTSENEYENTVFQFTVGMQGEIGDTGLTWDIYGSHGETRINQSQKSGGASYSRIQNLLTSRYGDTDLSDDRVTPGYVPPFLPGGHGASTGIVNPAYAEAVNDGGASFVDANGNRPCPEGLDLFGETELSASCAEYLQINPTSRTRIEQQVMEATVQGALWDLPAGDLLFAVGGGYRSNDYRFTPSPAGTDLVGSFGTRGSAGSIEVTEAYSELVIPLLSDLTLVDYLEAGLAYRYSDYDVSGSVSTYKADFSWRVNDAFRLRGGYQRAIRAPNVTELFSPASVVPALLSGLEDPCNFDSQARTGPNADQVRQLCLDQGVPASIIDSYKTSFAAIQAIRSGNLDLEPEEADTYTLGGIWQSNAAHPLARDLSISVDYFNIEINDAISSLPADINFTRCFNQDGQNPEYSQQNLYCQNIIREPGTGNTDDVLTPYANIGFLRSKGVDFQVNWGAELAELGLGGVPGRIGINSVFTRLLGFEVQADPGAPVQDFSGTIGYGATGNNGAQPDWKANTNFTYSYDQDRQVGVRWYYVDAMEHQSSVTSPDSPLPGVDSYSRYDLFANWRLSETLSLSAGVTNLLDEEPEATQGGVPGNTDSGTYDPLGRRYFLTVRANLF